MQLTDRDEQIIEWVYQLRFATAEQIQALLFTPASASSCRHRLTLLYHNGYLDRRLMPLRSAFGANRAVYCLDRRGAELLGYRNKTGAPLAWRPADNDRELYFLQHLVDTNDFRVSVTLGAKNINVNLDWLDERTLRTQAMKQMVKDPRRQGQLLAVVPDGYFSISEEGRRQGFALELDRSTVEEKRFRTKVRALGEWKVTGAYKKAVDIASLRVLFVVSSTERDPKRLEHIIKWTQAEGGENLFWFTELSNVTPASVFTGHIWQVAGRHGTVPLLRTSN